MKNLPAKQEITGEMQVRSLVGKILGEGQGILVFLPENQDEEPVGLQSMGLKKGWTRLK